MSRNNLFNWALKMTMFWLTWRGARSPPSRCCGGKISTFWHFSDRALAVQLCSAWLFLQHVTVSDINNRVSSHWLWRDSGSAASRIQTETKQWGEKTGQLYLPHQQTDNHKLPSPNKLSGSSLSLPLPHFSSLSSDLTEILTTRSYKYW